MDKIDTSQVSDPTSEQPFLAPSLAFLQNATKDMLNGLAYGQLGDTLYGSSSSVGVAISGCNYNGFGTSIFFGYIFYNNELYSFSGATGLNLYSNVPVVVQDFTDDTTIDPIEFTDGALKNVHKKRRLKVVDQASGTGLFDLANLKSVNKNNGTFGLLSTFSTTGSTQQSVTGATYTTPPGINRNFKIVFYGNLVFTSSAGVTVEGGKLAIRNSTTSTDLAVNYAEIQGVAGTNGAILQIPFYIRIKVANVSPGTTFIGTVQRAQVAAADVTLQNGYWEVEEY